MEHLATGGVLMNIVTYIQTGLEGYNSLLRGLSHGYQQVERLHHLAYEQCFIANSIKTHVRIERGDA